MIFDLEIPNDLSWSASFLSFAIILSAWLINNLEIKFGAGGFEKFWTQKNFLPIIRQSKTAAIWFVFCLASQTKLIFSELMIFLKVLPKEDRTEIFKTLTLRVLTLFDFFTYATFDSHFNPQIKAFTRGKKKLN